MGIIFANSKLAKARIMYESLVLSKKKDNSQTLLVPEFIELSTQDALYLNEITPILQTKGFSIRPFGKSSFLIEAYPVALGGIALDECIKEIVKNRDFDESEDPARFLRKLAELSLISSSKSLPKNSEEALYLLRELSKCHEATFCPAGKPIFSTMSLEEIRNTYTS